MSAIDKLICEKCGKVGDVYCSDEWDGPPGEDGYYLRCACGHYPTYNCWDDSGGPYQEAEELLSMQSKPPSCSDEPEMESEVGAPPRSAPATGSPNAQGVVGKTQSEECTQEADTQRLALPQAEGRPERPEGARWESVRMSHGASND